MTLEDLRSRWMTPRAWANATVGRQQPPRRVFPHVPQPGERERLVVPQAKGERLHAAVLDGPLVEPIDGDQAPPEPEAVAEERLVGRRLRTGITRSLLGVVRPVRDQPPRDGRIVEADDLDLAVEQAADEAADADAGRAVVARQMEAVGVEQRVSGRRRGNVGPVQGKTPRRLAIPPPQV
jgi:hypothetical protein